MRSRYFSMYSSSEQINLAVNRVRRHVARDDASGADNRIGADGDAGQNERLRADETAVFDDDGRETVAVATTAFDASAKNAARTVVRDEIHVFAERDLVADFDEIRLAAEMKISG